MELLNHLQYYQSIYMNIFPSQSLKQYARNIVFSKSDADEEFYFPSKKYELNQSELKKIKDHFSASNNIRNKTLKLSK